MKLSKTHRKWMLGTAIFIVASVFISSLVKPDQSFWIPLFLLLVASLLGLVATEWRKDEDN